MMLSEERSAWRSRSQDTMLLRKGRYVAMPVYKHHPYNEGIDMRLQAEMIAKDATL
jgi:hypothetical protein